MARDEATAALAAALWWTVDGDHADPEGEAVRILAALSRAGWTLTRCTIGPNEADR